MKNNDSTLSQSARDLYDMFLQEYIHFGYAHGGILSESHVCKTFTRDTINDLLEQHLIQKQEKVETICYELTTAEKKKLLEENNLVQKWNISLGTTLLCDRELSRVYGKENPQIDQLIHEARLKKQNNSSTFQKHDFLL